MTRSKMRGEWQQATEKRGIQEVCVVICAIIDMEGSSGRGDTR